MTHDDPTTDDPSGTATDPARAPPASPAGRLRTGRREFLAAVGAGVAAPTLSTGTATAQEGFTDFVETDGAQFVVDGQPVYFNGSNNFWITDDSEGSQERIDRVFALFEELGIAVVRMWAHGEAKSGDLTLQPEPGVHNEAALKLHDYAVYAARRHGIRLIVALVDNWDHEGGMLQYAEWTGGSSREHFYTDPEARDLYRNHVETMLTRENHITGVEWRDDPTIMMWELANEPRLEADDTIDGRDPDDVVRANDEHREILGEWIQDMSAYVKELDPNHLVSTGSEGHWYGGFDDGYPDDNWDGQDFVEHHSYDTIDACSFHWYPDHWWCHGECDGPGDVPLERGSDWIANHVETAREELGKPAYLGEFNVNAQDHGVATRNDHLESYYETADQVDCAAMVPWQVVLDDTDDHDGFQLYRDESGYIIEDYADTVRGKSAGRNGEPLADAAVPDSLRVGETGSFLAKYSRGASGSITDREWSFADGATAGGEHVERSFAEPGEVEVELSVTDASGATATDTEVVTVEALPEDSFLVEGAGEQVADDVAQFHFAHTTVSGDFSVEARVASVQSTSTVAQAGIMALNDPAAADALGAVALTPGNGTEQVRSYNDSSPVWLERTRDDRSAPLWLRLEREGGYVYSSVSVDGESWTEIQDGQVAFDEEVHVGLFVSSNSPGELCSAQFDGADWLTDWSATDVGDVQVAGSTTAGDGESGTDGPTCGGVEVAETAEVEGQTVCDVNGDELFRDVTADGEVGQDDVVHFFENQHRDAWKLPDLFDFSGSGSVGHGDVVSLFEDVSL